MGISFWLIGNTPKEMELITPVGITTKAPTINSNASLLMLGSCFAQEVGARLVPQMPEGHILVNPLGTMYSPTAIASTLRQWARSEQPAAPFQGQDGCWHSWQAASVCSATTAEECNTKLNAAWQSGQDFLRSASHLIVTFGTTRYYALTDNALASPVMNCHKEPAARFIEVEPTLEEIIADWQALLAELLAINPSLRVITTVSPYRYRKYGFHTSQLQKAKLLLLCDALSGATYFPSYEILLDELRDYRFYATDMLHPSEQAVDIIAERFRQWAFSPALLHEADERLRLWRKSQHRTLVK